MCTHCMYIFKNVTAIYINNEEDVHNNANNKACAQLVVVPYSWPFRLIARKTKRKISIRKVVRREGEGAMHRIYMWGWQKKGAR